MPASLLQTKLYLPRPRPGLVARPRLIERLNAGLHGRLTLVCAPAGFGKTTLVSAWLGGRDERGAIGDEFAEVASQHAAPRAHDWRIAWLSLDRGDDDVQRFLSYLVAALRQADQAVGEVAWAMLQSTQPPTAEQVLTTLINDLATSTDRWLLVLDDYHVVSAAAVHDALGFLVEHLPLSLHLVIASRADPPLALARLRARGEINELRARDLRFADEEAAAFLRQTMGIDLADTEVALLERRTEGWIAGLQLAAHSLVNQENRQAFLTAFAGDDRFVADYLIEEVLARQPLPVQDFLLQTAVLESLTAPLCDAVTDRADSQVILASLEQANLFIVPLDNRRQWYRYHQLFADLLRERLSESAYPVALLHGKASQWYAGNGFHAAAIDHALAAGEQERAIELIEERAAFFFSSSELTTLVRWWSRLPAELVATHPRLAMAYAWAFLATGQPEQAESCLAWVEQAIGWPMAALLDDPAVAAPLSDAAAAALAEVAVIRVNLAMGELDLAKASRLARAILPHLEIAPETFLFNRPDDLRAVVEFTSGLVELYSGQLDAAAASLQSAWRLAQGQGNVHLAALAVGNLASLQLTRGQFRQAERTCEIGAQALAEMPWSRSPMTGVVHAHWGTACYVRNDLAGARAHYLEAIRFAKPWSNWEALLPGYLGIARLGRAEGDWTAAFEALDDMERHVLGSAPAVQAHAEAVRALYRAELGDSSLLDRWLNHHRADFDSAALPVQEESSTLLARLLHVHGDDAAAAVMLSALLAGAEAGGRWGRVIEILVLQALVHASAGQPALAQAALARALRLAQPEDALRPFVDAGQPMVELLKHARRAGVTPDLCRRLLAAFAPQAGPEAGPHPAAPLAAGDDLMHLEPLTEREREVLALLAQGLSNKAIARTLVLTEGTVKAHAHTIYAKLAVNTRTEAVARARHLGILPR